MMFPKEFVESAKTLLGDEYSLFENALQKSSPTSIRINDKIKFEYLVKAVKWCPFGFYLDERPSFTADPLFHAGAYYVQEASSMFLHQVAKQYFENADTVLDLCAAPGGKSTLLLQTLSKNSLLVANEIIRSRAYILDENITKWGNTNVIVTNNKPADFEKLSGFFNAIVIDAPCSGEGMFRKDAGAIEEWSLQNIDLCAERQRTIINDVWNCLKTDGILVYSTCTYNTKENEENVRWICEELGAEVLKVNISQFEEIVETKSGYRFFPHRTKGEGFFIAVLRKNAETEPRKKVKSKPAVSKSKISDFTDLKLRSTDNIFILETNKLRAYNPNRLEDILFLENNLNCLRSGLLIGEKKSKDFVFAHQTALSKDLKTDSVNSIELEYKTAISFLKKEAIQLENAPLGYNLVKFMGVPIGWVKNVGTRCNNLYPNEWRIRANITGDLYHGVLKIKS